MVRKPTWYSASVVMMMGSCVASPSHHHTLNTEDEHLCTQHEHRSELAWCCDTMLTIVCKIMNNRFNQMVGEILMIICFIIIKVKPFHPQLRVIWSEHETILDNLNFRCIWHKSQIWPAVRGAPHTQHLQPLSWDLHPTSYNVLLYNNDDTPSSFIHSSSVLQSSLGSLDIINETFSCFYITSLSWSWSLSTLWRPE